MNNFKMDVVSEGDQSLEYAFQIAFGRHSGATHWLVKDNVLGFFWVDPKITGHPAQPFVVRYSAAECADFAKKWLERGADYGREPDHDGDNGKGWHVSTEGWGHVFGSYAGIVKVAPAWAMYGK